MLGTGDGQPPAKPLNVKVMATVSRVPVISNGRPQIVISNNASSIGGAQSTIRYPSVEVDTSAKRSRVDDEQIDPSCDPQLVNGTREFKTEKRYICQSCPFYVEFPSEEVYLRHMDLAHVNNPNVLRAQGITVISPTPPPAPTAPVQVPVSRPQIVAVIQGGRAIEQLPPMQAQVPYSARYQGGFALSRSALEHLVSMPPLGLNPEDLAAASSPQPHQIEVKPKKKYNKRAKQKTGLVEIQRGEESWVPEHLRPIAGNLPSMRGKRGRKPKSEHDAEYDLLSEDVSEDAMLVKHSMSRRKKGFSCIVEGCRATFESGEDLFEHVESNHDKKQAFICGTCYAMFVRAFHFVSHMLDTKHEDRFGGLALTANEEGPGLDPLAVSLAQGEKPEKTHPCTQCGMSFIEKSNLTEHKRLHHPEQTCKTCHQVFKNKYYLQKHRKAVHLNDVEKNSEESRSGGDEDELPISVNTSMDLGSPRALSSAELVPSLPTASILMVMNEEEERALISDVLSDPHTDITVGGEVVVPEPSPSLSNMGGISASPFRTDVAMPIVSANANDSFSVVSCEHCMVLCLSATELEQHVQSVHAVGS